MRFEGGGGGQDTKVLPYEERCNGLAGKGVPALQQRTTAGFFTAFRMTPRRETLFDCAQGRRSPRPGGQEQAPAERDGVGAGERDREEWRMERGGTYDQREGEREPGGLGLGGAGGEGGGGGTRRWAMNAPNVLQVSVSQQHWAQGIERNLRRTIEHIRIAWEEGSDVILFPEANLTGYDFPYLLGLSAGETERALEQVQEFVRDAGLYVICGTIQRRGDDERFLNLAHVIAPNGEIIHEYAKIQMAGEEEQRYCRPGNKLSLFEIKGFAATIVICRDGRHPELYRLPAMAGAQILFQPACSTETVEALWWKREAGRATQAAGPTTSIFHCCANTVGQDYGGKQTSSGGSFIKHPTGLSLAEADWYSEMVITARLDMEAADRRYALASAEQPEFLQADYQRIIEEIRARKDERPG